MGESTAIGWTDHTFNPWWGCTRVSPACQNCYAEAFAKRTGHAVWGNNAPRRFFGDKHWAEPLKWNAKAVEAGVRRRVFCASMADVFEDDRSGADVLWEPRERLWDLIADTPSLDWLLLTKRPENIESMTPDWVGGIEEWSGYWPENVWIGTTVEDQQRANERVPTLIANSVPERGPEPVRFLSCEPLLGEVDLTPWLDEGIDWVICGGESGPRHRPLDLDHARHVRDQCEAFGVPFFFKQVGGHTPTAGGDLLDGIEYKQTPRPIWPGA